MANLIFKPYCHPQFQGCYKHIVTEVPDRVTISYGFYNRTNNNAQQSDTFTVNPKCVFDFPFGQGWYFGVNLRIKCQQGQTSNQKNIDLAKAISHFFCKFTIPHYINNDNDQGVDFFVFPIIIGTNQTLNDFLRGWCNGGGFINTPVQNIFEDMPENIEEIDIIDNPDNIDKWVEEKINELLGLLPGTLL